MTACYKLIWKPSAEKELRRLPRDIIAKLIKIAEALSSNPYPSGSKKLSGTQHVYRIRSGDYRLIYEVNGSELIIHIVRVGHRQNVYR